jgi:hypothetical protein
MPGSLRRISLIPFTLFVAILAGCVTITPRGQRGGAPATEEGIVSPLHEAHRGRIVFAGEEIPRDAAADFPLADRLRADEPIWGRVYLERSAALTVAGLPDPDRNCRWANRRSLRTYVSLDGADERAIADDPAGEKTWGHFTTMNPTGERRPLAPVEELFIPQGVASVGARLHLILAQLPDGEHRVAMRVAASCHGKPEATIAQGEVTIVVDAAARAALAGTIRLASAEMASAEEVARVTEAVRSAWRDVAVEHVRLLEAAWRVRRNPDDVPLSREIAALVVVRKGDGCAVFGTTVHETHEGGGRYGAPTFREHHDGRMRERPVPCEIDVRR